MNLTKLGNPQPDVDGVLETFETVDAEQVVRLTCSEFTCRCPITNQPDWARITITYKPVDRVVETKSLKLYLETYREQGIFNEHLVTAVRDHLVAALAPRWITVSAEFNARGGIAVRADSTYNTASELAIAEHSRALP